MGHRQTERETHTVRETEKGSTWQQEVASSGSITGDAQGPAGEGVEMQVQRGEVTMEVVVAPGCLAPSVVAPPTVP